jgi:hypothetical protein
MAQYFVRNIVFAKPCGCRLVFLHLLFFASWLNYRKINIKSFLIDHLSSLFFSLMKSYLFVTALALAFTASCAQSNTAAPGEY